MTSKSLWMDIEVMPAAGQLAGDKECDVAVIGSGIAGIQPPTSSANAANRSS